MKKYRVFAMLILALLLVQEIVTPMLSSPMGEYSRAIEVAEFDEERMLKKNLMSATATSESIHIFWVKEEALFYKELDELGQTTFEQRYPLVLDSPWKVESAMIDGKIRAYVLNEGSVHQFELTEEKTLLEAGVIAQGVKQFEAHEDYLIYRTQDSLVVTRDGKTLELLEYDSLDNFNCTMEDDELLVSFFYKSGKHQDLQILKIKGNEVDSKMRRNDVSSLTWGKQSAIAKGENELLLVFSKTINVHQIMMTDLTFIVYGADGKWSSTHALVDGMGSDMSVSSFRQHRIELNAQYLKQRTDEFSDLGDQPLFSQIEHSVKSKGLNFHQLTLEHSKIENNQQITDTKMVSSELSTFELKGYTYYLWIDSTNESKKIMLSSNQPQVAARENRLKVTDINSIAFTVVVVMIYVVLSLMVMVLIIDVPIGILTFFLRKNIIRSDAIYLISVFSLILVKGFIVLRFLVMSPSTDLAQWKMNILSGLLLAICTLELSALYKKTTEIGESFITVSAMNLIYFGLGFIAYMILPVVQKIM